VQDSCLKCLPFLDFSFNCQLAIRLLRRPENYGTNSFQQQEYKMVKRMSHMVKLQAEVIPEYKRIHAAVWPEILQAIYDANIRNYSIFLKEPENWLIAYWEYIGDDFEADTAKIKSAPRMQEWWDITDPMQIRFETAKPGEWWASMEEVFHTD
jgi:L-rhamnose mutarotase